MDFETNLSHEKYRNYKNIHVDSIQKLACFANTQLISPQKVYKILIKYYKFLEFTQITWKISLKHGKQVRTIIAVKWNYTKLLSI